MTPRINASSSGQLAIKPILNRLLTYIKGDDKDNTVRLFPTIAPNDDNLFEKVLIIDPHVSFGNPTITNVI